jgi:hypothetical protein
VSELAPFVGFPKIPRMSRAAQCVITEKIDGTNAHVLIQDGKFVAAGSRTRWITPGDDNYGFAAWAYENADALVGGLGDGHHFGEWYGRGIQRNYGLTERRFALFNTGRWSGVPLPTGVDVVPVLYHGPFSIDTVDWELDQLWVEGSRAVPGFKNPEGVIVYLNGSLMKHTFDGPKHQS